MTLAVRHIISHAAGSISAMPSKKSSVASGFCPIAAGAGSQLFISKSAPATAQAPSASSSNTGFGNLAKLRIVIPLLFAGLVRRIAAASIARQG